MAGADMSDEIQYENGKALMAQVAQALHEHLSIRVEVALGKALPQMEMRFQNLSITANVTVSDEHGDTKSELPTIANHLKKSLAGVPGSSKSSLMKILSGRFPIVKNIPVEGGMTYNCTQEELRRRLPQLVAYFAHACCGGELSARAEQMLTKGTPEENKATLEAARAVYTHMPEVVIQQLSMDNCQDTIVGDAMTRSVSIGECKRVMTGEMKFGMKFVTLMDEISTGLDSAATFDIAAVNCQEDVKDDRDRAAAATTPAVPRDVRQDAFGYFRVLGFVFPPRRDVADFLLDLCTPQQQQYQPQMASDFANVFARSSVHLAKLAHLHGPHDPLLLADTDLHMQGVPEFRQSFVQSTKPLMARQTKVTMHNTAFLTGRTIMAVVMGLPYASTFYQFDPTKAQEAMGVISRRRCSWRWARHRRKTPHALPRTLGSWQRRAANFYRTSSYVLSCLVSQIPLALLESVVFGLLIYWICGFVATVKALAFDTIVQAVTDVENGSSTRMFFVDGPESCWRLLLRDLPQHYLLHGGKPAHFRFKVPIEVHESSTCNIPVESPLAKLIQRAIIIVWDVAPMNRKFVSEAVDKTLQDACNSTMPFGGKTVIFGGDFRKRFPLSHAQVELTLSTHVSNNHTSGKPFKF
ncbi:TPA: hypothetical protein N0F65_006559 [Lagenidium giganteum]|uniref:ATP-dependent DNA helicase n=1 Tax=Lagenidium giganteum TaxID=4803 RepID=A0AAV2YND0_9STRA|nr:TPA: hypothetical protein N0F65_006559 [Lagenidium giganteum]